MGRKSLGDIMKDIKTVLEKKGELSIRQLALKTKSQWHTTEKALELMKSMNVVKERLNDMTKRKERLFSLAK